MATAGNPVSWTLTGLVDLVRVGRDRRRLGLSHGDRLDGRTCLVTGANSGLGLATAVDLARRGGRVLMACRSGIPEAGEEVRRRSGSPMVEMLKVDLSDLASVDALCDELVRREIRVDVLVLNAGVMPARSRLTRQGFELMFGVNYLAHAHLTERLLADGVVRPDVVRPDPPRPRIVIVSSEVHRGAPPIDLEALGEPVEYGVTGGMAQYGHTKLLLCAYARELARTTAPDGEIEIAVHALCPGPVDSNMARESPWWLRPILRPVMRTFFASPEVAARPVVHLACARELEGRTGLYWHIATEKEPSPHALDPEIGAHLRAATRDLATTALAGS